MSSNNNKSNKSSKSNTLNRKSEITIYEAGEININLNSNTKYLEMYKEDLYDLYNRKNIAIAIAILRTTRCSNSGKCYFDEDEDETVFIKLNSSEGLFIKQGKKKFEYVPKAYILIMDKNNFNKSKFNINVKGKTMEEIEEELILNYERLKIYIENIKESKSNILKNINQKKTFRESIISIREFSEKNDRLLDYYFSSLERQMLRLR